MLPYLMSFGMNHAFLAPIRIVLPTIKVSTLRAQFIFVGSILVLLTSSTESITNSSNTRPIL